MCVTQVARAVTEVTLLLPSNLRDRDLFTGTGVLVCYSKVVARRCRYYYLATSVPRATYAAPF